MNFKFLLLLIPLSAILSSCWKPLYPRENRTKVLGYRPIYGSDASAKKISYIDHPQAAIIPGNIYAFRSYIFQIDPGLGIHVFDNSVPSQAKKIGFINVRGCAEMSIKNDKLYTNSYEDLVVLDVSDLKNLKEYSRLSGVFNEYRYGSPLAQPPMPGWYECPSFDSLVVGWVQDSVYQICSK